MESFGLTEDDYANDVATENAIEIWPENLKAVVLFKQLSTQWRYSFSGATGLDYNVLFKKLDRMQLSDEQYTDLEEDVRVMENAALKAMAQSRKQD